MEPAATNRIGDMLDVIQNNPYRILGVYSNSPIKERIANQNRLKAYLAVGKPVAFPLDIAAFLPQIDRTLDAVSQANSQLTLPNDQLRYAQFWFIRANSFDEIAFNHLLDGNMDEAVSVWEKKDNTSSLQNRIVCALLKEQYSIALDYAGTLYSEYASDFAQLVLGADYTIAIDGLAYDFLDTLCDAIGAQKVLNNLHNADWTNHIRSKAIQPLLDTLQSAVNTAKSSRGTGITQRYNAGVLLRDSTKQPLAELKKLVGVGDLQYQTIADKVGLEILQCAIDYYNGSEAADAAHKAMRLQSYALSIVVGKMAKDRCQENVDILQKIIDELPPREVFAEDKAIKDELRKYSQLPDKITYAVDLLNNTKPHLQSIQQKLGVSDAYYLRVSTLIVAAALHNIIEEVNDVQKEETIEIDGHQVPISILTGSKDARLTQIKSVFREAWEAVKIMDTFDKEMEFKKNRYDEQRSILEKMCKQLGMPTLRADVIRQFYTSTPPRSAPPHTPTPPTPTSSKGRGCLIAFIVWIVIGCIAGGICVANGGDFATGFGISGIIVLFLSGLFG